ncbi:MAG: site-specific DNA-methyltransferase [Selenomonadaceae bacterium]|nr:site-specific DNA-methyltransferase [Selenomonadaceae bacterium]
MPTLNWIGKDKVVNHAAAVPFHVLEHKYNFGGASENKIIHGDNLLALKSLLPEYEGRVKCIYIDPPYNTGNEDWIYNDNVNSPQIKKWLGQIVGKEGEDLSRHDKWLCMMYPRLKLLKKLLADDGAIFISIDDNEQANLKLICDEIFGANNFVAQLVWEKKRKGAFLSKTVTNIKEYIVVYCKSQEAFGGLVGEINRSPETYPCVKTTNPRGVRILQRGIPSKFKEKNYRIAANTRSNAGNTELIFLDEAVIENGILQTSPRVDSNWIYQQDLLDEYATRGELFITSGLNLRRVVLEPRIKMLKDLLLRVGNDDKAEGSFTYDENLNNGGWGTNEDANEELHKIFGKQYVFEFSKPSRLIGKLIQSVTDKNSIVLDSFAGSGTTAHAVLNLNAKDGGNRKFILVEMEDYAESITAERVRRVIQGYGQTAGTGGNFDFYEVGESLMIQGNLNQNIDIETIHAYIWYTETHTQHKKLSGNNNIYLGNFNGTAIYFYYERNRKTILDNEFLRSIKLKADSYLIYADACTLTEDFLTRNSIIFKKIPRDIKKLGSDDL